MRNIRTALLRPTLQCPKRREDVRAHPLLSSKQIALARVPRESLISNN
jgi:hypothetical protein